MGDSAQQRRGFQVSSDCSSAHANGMLMSSCSMWPLLKREGLGLQYLVLTLFWNFVIGYNPLSLRPSFVKFLSIVSPLSPASQRSLTLLPSSPTPPSSSSTLSKSSPPLLNTSPTSSSSSTSPYPPACSASVSSGPRNAAYKKDGPLSASPSRLLVPQLRNRRPCHRGGRSGKEID